MTYVHPVRMFYPYCLPFFGGRREFSRKWNFVGNEPALDSW